MKICGIYKITNQKGNIYIGQSIDIVRRFNVYKRADCKEQIRLFNSFKKYGIENHSFEIVCQCDKSELNNLEIYYINLYQCFNSEYGLNLHSGGDVHVVSSETRMKMSIARKGKKFYEMTDEIRKKISESNKGKTYSQEYKDKMSKSLSGKNNPRYGNSHSIETKEKLSASHKGKKHSEETKAKMRIAKKNNRAFAGRKHSEETKLKMRLSKLKAA